MSNDWTDVCVLEILLSHLPQYVSRKTVERVCEAGRTGPSSLWFVYEGVYCVVLTDRSLRGNWLNACTVPAPAGAAAYGRTLWELSK